MLPANIFDYIFTKYPAREYNNVDSFLNFCHSEIENMKINSTDKVNGMDNMEISVDSNMVTEIVNYRKRKYDFFAN